MATFGFGVLNQPNYLGPGTSVAHRLPSPNISGTCLAPQSHRLSRPCPIDATLCHSARGSITICFKVPLTKQWEFVTQWMCHFHALAVGAVGCLKPDHGRSGIPQSLHGLQQEVFKLPSKRAPRSIWSVGDVKCIMGLISFMDSNCIYILSQYDDVLWCNTTQYNMINLRLFAKASHWRLRWLSSPQMSATTVIYWDVCKGGHQWEDPSGWGQAIEIVWPLH